MRATVLLCAVLGGVAAVSCGKTEVSPVPPAGQKCTANACFIEVTVNGDCHTADNIKVLPDPMNVDKTNHGGDNNGPEIHWDIKTDGFTFNSVQTGIVFGTSPMPPSGEFSNPNLNGPKTKYILKDKNSSTASYKYTINLDDRNGSACAPKDPFIANGQ